MSVFILYHILLPLTASADNHAQKTVRVGWYDSSFCYYDQFGRRRGADYEYHQRISVYTGWEYEYVEDSWPNLLQKLKDGEIDLLGDVSYKPDREEYMYFSALPMGTEAYYIYIASDNDSITAADLSAFNGMRIGVNRNSLQEGLLKQWAENNNIHLEIVELTSTENESMDMISRKELDGIASVFDFDYNRDVIPITRIGGSDYYYAVSKERPDLLAELNMAMENLHNENPNFNENLTTQRLYNTKTSALLTPEQEKWLAEHGEIRVGYRENYLPFCSTDAETGELTGALKDYLAHAVNNMNSQNLHFKTIPYASTEAALAALNSGEVDCVFPLFLSTYDAAERGIFLTDPAMETSINAIMRVSDRQDLSDDSALTFAVNADMINMDSFIMEHYLYATRRLYPDLESCFQAVTDGEADCILVSNYRIPSEEDTLRKNNLFTVPTGETLSFSFAIRKPDFELYSVMNKTAATTKNSEMGAALASYLYQDQKVSFMRFLKDNLVVVLSVLMILFAVILFLLWQKLQAERVANRQRHLLEEAAQVEKLHQTISSLLNNMPGIYLSKDADTGKYLACNQMFADYVHKKDPSELIGLTAADIFDADTAEHFEEDDKTVLSMDEPLIYYDSMNDMDGKTVSVKITKLKYTDANGRICVLGIFQDVSDSLRISREKASSKESYENARSSGMIFSHIAQVLAQGYESLFYVDLNTEQFIEYRSDADGVGLSEVRRGWHFFEEWQDAAMVNIHPEDRDEVIRAMDRKTLVAALDQNPFYMVTYRMMLDQNSKYVNMKITRMQDDERFIILSITDVDEQIKHRQAVQRLEEEQTAYSRICALAGEFLCIYVMTPETGFYREYSSAAGLETFAMPKEGRDFFSDFRENSIRIVHPDEKNRVFTALTMENVMQEIQNNGIFTLTFRMILENEPRYVQLKAAIIEESDGKRMVIGVNDIDAQVRQEEEYGRRLAQARIEANIDALTGINNRNAYRVYEERLNAQIEMNSAPEFAIVLLDVNDLKKVNDTEGHKAGDQFLRDACKIICMTFKRSPVFRVGGDEFVALCQGDDFSRLAELTEIMRVHNENALADGGIVIAMGVSCYENDANVAQVYERADQKMYENKRQLKERKNLRE